MNNMVQGKNERFGKGFSIIVCCYNSEMLLPHTLKHIAQLKVVSGFPWELIIVNNNSTDATVAVAKAEWKKYPGTAAGFQIVNEPAPGLTNARKAGVAAAVYDYIVFCDDDNWLSEDYLEVAYAVMGAEDAIGALGGRVEAVTDTPLPGWWQAFQHDYAVGPQGPFSGDATARKYLWGAGMVTRKRLMQEVFHTRHPFILDDRMGTGLGSGGDSEICARLMLMQYKLWYEEKLSLQHYLPAARLGLSYRTELRKGHVMAQTKLDAYYNIIYYSLLRPHAKIKLTVKYIAALFTALKREQRVQVKKRINYIWCRPIWSIDDVPAGIFKVSRFLAQKKRHYSNAV